MATVGAVGHFYIPVEVNAAAVLVGRWQAGNSGSAVTVSFSPVKSLCHNVACFFWKWLEKVDRLSGWFV